MGTKIQDIVDVDITRETAKLTRLGFGTPLILSEHGRFSERAKTYSDPSEMLDDGFLITDEAYIAALTMFSQELSPEQFKVGRKLGNKNAKQKFVFSVEPDAGTFTITFSGQTTAAIAYNANAAAIKAALELLSNINEVTVVGAIDEDGFTVEFTGEDASASKATMTATSSLTESSNPVTITISVEQYGSATENWNTALNAVIAFDDDWYGLCAETRTKADILALAAIIETKIKIYLACSDDADVKTSVSSDVASSLKALNYDRTWYIWSGDEEHYPEAGILGLQLPKNPGSSNFKFRQIAGIIADTLSTTELTYMRAKYANTIETISDLTVISSEGKVASGEFIDIIIGTDFVQVRLAENIFVRLVEEEKVPFTDEGGTVWENEIRAVLDLASNESYPILVKSTIVVTIPKVAAIDPADKSARDFSGITFSADYQGACNKVSMRGKFSF